MLPSGSVGIDREIGRRIATQCVNRGLTVEILAAAAGLTIEALKRIERGEDRAAASMLYALCQSLDCPVAQLLQD